MGERTSSLSFWRRRSRRRNWRKNWERTWGCIRILMEQRTRIRLKNDWGKAENRVWFHFACKIKNHLPYDSTARTFFVFAWKLQLFAVLGYMTMDTREFKVWATQLSVGFLRPESLFPFSTRFSFVRYIRRWICVCFKIIFLYRFSTKWSGSLWKCVNEDGYASQCKNRLLCIFLIRQKTTLFCAVKFFS